jgi:hypothetical protein
MVHRETCIRYRTAPYIDPRSVFCLCIILQGVVLQTRGRPKGLRWGWDRLEKTNHYCCFFLISWSQETESSPPKGKSLRDPHVITTPLNPHRVITPHALSYETLLTCCSIPYIHKHKHTIKLKRNPEHSCLEV